MPAQFTKHFVQDLQQDIKIRQCGTIVFNADNESNIISVDLYNGTEPYSGGGSVAGAVICPDGATVALDNGTLTGNVASVTLKADCFAIPGQIGIGVQVISGSIRTTVLKAIYNVELLSTDNMVDPDSRITASVTQLVADIEAATAEIPASDMASLMAGIAPTFSTSTNYAAGAYVYYNGTLYRFTTAHAAGSWTGTDATAVALGNDVSDLKSALSIKHRISSEWQNKTISGTTGAETASENRISTVDYILGLTIPIYVTAPIGFQFSFRYYAEQRQGSIIGSTNWLTGTQISNVQPGQFFKVVVSKVNGENIDITDGDYINIESNSITDTSLTMIGKAADAKVVGDIVNVLKANNVLNVEWQNKNINGERGVETENSKRISTVDFIDSKYMPYIVSVPTGMQYSFRYYTSPSSSAIIGTTDWMTEASSPAIQNGQYFKVVASYVNNEYINYSEGAKVSIGCISATDKSLTQEDKCADAKVVGDLLRPLVDSGIVGRNNTAETTLKLQQLTQIPRIGSNSYGNKPLCLLHFSDLHNDEQRLKNIVEYADHYANYLDDIINTGDTVFYSSSDGLDAWNNVDGTERILNTIGNHDTRVGDTWIGQTEAESYAMYLAPYISNWNVTSYSANHCYYYKDYTTENVRLIVLDIMHQTAEQLSWFESALASALTAGLHVIVAVHSRAHWLYDSYQTPWDDKPVVEGYANGYYDKSSSVYPENLSDDYANAVDSFMSDGGFFVAWIHGHTHFKMFAKLQTHTNQLDVAVANAGIVPFARTYVNNRVAGNKSEDSFNVLAVDTTSKILRIMAVGATYDRYMRLTDTISYNYETHELLYSN